MPEIIKSIDLVTNFYTYEGVVKALNRVSIPVDHGFTFGLVGESGCGKSVFVRSLMRIIQEPGKIEAGQIIFYPQTGENKAPKSIDLLKKSESFMESLRGDRISMIFQEPNSALNPIMRIGNQIAESFLFHRKKEMSLKILDDLNSPGCRTFPVFKAFQQKFYKIQAGNPESFLLKIVNKIPVVNLWNKRLKKEALDRSAEIMGKLGIPNPEKVLKLYPHNLSGGMKQRIVIAIALACSPVLLIADEATSNLDVTIQAQILELLKTLKQTEISSILLITHDLGVVAETCDRVGVMYAGNLCEIADVKDLFTSPRHPYTRALLNAVPKISHKGELDSIEGSVPNLVSPPPGCRFHPRCPRAGEPCRKNLPDLVELGKNHYAACFYPEN